MFERFTEKARRTIFFGRFEAGKANAVYISPVHMLMGLLQEDPTLFTPYLPPGSTAEGLRAELAAGQPMPLRQSLSTSADVPFSHECKRALAYAGAAAEKSGSRYIRTDHLLLGLMQDPGPVSDFLAAHGITRDHILNHTRHSSTPEEIHSKQAHLHHLITLLLPESLDDAASALGTIIDSQSEPPPAH